MRFPYLRLYTRITLLKLFDVLQKENLTRNTLLFSQGQPFTHFYLIIYGEFEQLWNKQKSKAGKQD